MPAVGKKSNVFYSTDRTTISIIRAGDCGWYNWLQTTTMDFSFVQFFEVVDLMYEMERKTRCITLRCERASSKDKNERSLNPEGRTLGTSTV